MLNARRREYLRASDQWECRFDVLPPIPPVQYLLGLVFVVVILAPNYERYRPGPNARNQIPVPGHLKEPWESTGDGDKILTLPAPQNKIHAQSCSHGLHDVGCSL